MDAVKLHSHQHPLNRSELSSGEESGVCGLCGEEVTNGSAYECSQCNFTAHLDCAENPPSLEINKSKIHEHTLTLLPRHVSFICNACGLPGEKSPYVCLKCCFMIHKDCIDFPRVVRISRHNHRLSHTWFLGHREWDCRICRRKVDGKYGAYNCTKGCSYVVHLRCAIRRDVWDGKELEGVPEEYEDIDDIKGFEEVSDSLIRHFSHPQHVLRLEDEDEGMRDGFCSGCSFPVASNPFYKCEECDFFLHKQCAYLPRWKTTFLHVHKLTLCTDNERLDGPNSLSRCNACDLYFNGFSYRCLVCEAKFDVKCSLVSEPFDYHFHPHPLLFNPGTDRICSVCNRSGHSYVLRCIKGDEFTLCFACATLPDTAIYKYDDHLLSHASGEDGTTNPDWCEICENKIEGKTHNYECPICGPALHTDCAVGSFRNMRPGFSFVTPHGHKYEVILNDRTSLLRCSQCHNDCNEPLLFMSTTTNTTIYLCSSPCFRAYVSV